MTQGVSSSPAMTGIETRPQTEPRGSSDSRSGAFDTEQPNCPRQVTVGPLRDKMNTLIDHLKDKYRRHYSKLSPIPWRAIHLNLHEVYTTLEVKEVKRGTAKAGKQLENLHDIFKSPDNRRIRIEGAPAMGKSTLCRKLAYDWSCGGLQQSRPLEWPSLLFFLEMRHIAENNMIGEIFNQLIPDDFDLSTQELLEIVSQNIDSVLFLCDGLDEPDERQVTSSEIPKLISEDLYSRCTVVITTRPHLCDKYLESCDLYLLVKGFTSRRTEEYILKYFKDDTQRGDSLIAEIKKQKESTDSLTDLLRNPLHVSFLCILWEYQELENDHFPETLSELYSDILECILKRYCVTYGIELNNGDVPENILEDRDKLAADSYKLFKNKQTNFDKTQISSEISLNFGLLVKDLGHAIRKCTEIYFFYHKTWLEYFTALHVNSQLKSQDTRIHQAFLEHPRKYFPVLKFIAGIATREEGRVLFNEFNRVVREKFGSLTCGYKKRTETSKYLQNLIGQFIKCFLESKYSEELIRCLDILKEDAEVNALCTFLENCDSTESLKLHMRYVSSSDLILKMKAALMKISPSLKSLHFVERFDELYNALSANTALNDIGMAIKLDTDGELICSYIKQNKYAKSMTIYDYGVLNNEMCQSIAAALRENKVLKHLKIETMYNGYTWIVMKNVLIPVSKEIETNQVTLDSITLRTLITNNCGCTKLLSIVSSWKN
ncbi:NACHT, LRR and PYD domains-containing protein 3-like [Ptychodera flava]|uniref:NACHT, LRR and PYD domains-containing protein 3-like n=1 Tax=Ptychodera flava TaxID=63121 RepID=UPI003969EC02